MRELMQHAFDRREFKYPLESSRWTRVIRAAGRYLPVERFDGVHDLSDIRTTYLDTANLASYREYVEDRPLRRKVRIRQYGYDRRFADRLWVEIKIKRYEDCMKRSFCCNADALKEMMSGRDILGHVEQANPQRSEAREIYRAVRSQILDRDLRPVVRVDYERLSFQEASSPESRITVDRRIRFRLARKSTKSSHEGTVLEVKYCRREPGWLGSLLCDLALQEPSRFSKYARAVRALGVDGHRRRGST